MTVEDFIARFARAQNARLLRFSSDASLALPRYKVNAPLLMYVHVPFCEELCPYCSFNRVVFSEDLARDYFEALRKEILMYQELGYQFSAVYVGGGTPTVLIDELVRTLELLRERFSITEISVETNPNHLTSANLQSLKGAGVNRLSVGVQSFDEQLLKAMERYHKYGSGKEISERLQSTQGMFDTLNVDMIFNFPLQTLSILEQDLNVLTDVKADQITYYPLMVSTSTQDIVKRKLGEMDYRREKRFYHKIVEMLTPHYQASTAWCFSRQATMIDEYVVTYDEYGGLGSGSFGYLCGCVYANTFDIAEYIGRIRAGELPLAARREFSLKERLRYDFLMKLFGIQLDLEKLREKWQRAIMRYLWKEILFFRMVGGLKRKGSLLRLTPRGQYYWVIMMREFFIAVNNFRDYCRTDVQGKKY